MFLLTDSVAGAVDFEVLASVGQRSQVAAQLAQARRQVARAQVQVDAARARLNAFLGDHFEPSAAGDTPGNSQPQPVNPEVERQTQQLTELRAQREQLLETYTEAHPEVIDVDSRIESLAASLAQLNGAGTPDAGGHSAAAARREAEAGEYRRLVGECDAAERELATAREAVSAAADRLAALGLVGLGASESRQPEDAEPIRTATPPAATAAPGLIVASPALPQPRAISAALDPQAAASRTQSLALASLALAVVLAALAAVRLARATSDPLFASADEAAAALGVPVVGIVPRSASRGAMAGAGLRWTLLIVALLLLAAVAISGIAYLVVNLAAVAAFCSDPIAGVRNLLSI